MQSTQHSRLLGAFALAAFLGIACSALAESQDYWEAGTDRKLATPDTTTARKCLAISSNGFYVGKLNASSKAVAIEQYAANGSFTKTWTTTFTDLGGLSVDIDGKVYAFDQGAAKVYVFDAQGTQVRTFGSAGTGDGQFATNSAYMVSAIAVDEAKNVFVADRGNSRVQVFDSSGSFKMKFGGQGDLPGQFRSGPVAVAVSPSGGVLAQDAGWHHLVKFSADGKVLKRSNGSYAEGDGFDAGGNSAYGNGADQIFAISSDGLLVVGAEATSYTWFGKTGRSTIFDSDSLLTRGTLEFRTNPGTRGAAFDPAGNFWAVHDKAVECIERRMRFGAHKPSKPLPQPLVTQVSQTPGSKIVDIVYRVVDSDSSTVTTALVGFTDGVRSWEKMVIPKAFTGSVSGELGSGVSSGTIHTLHWNAAADMVGKNFATLSFVALAKDDRPEVGVHYVSIPPDAVNSATLKISHKPVQDDDLKDLWTWLLGKGDARVAISGNTVVLTDAGKTYVTGAPLPLSGTSVANVVHNGSTTTTQGRAFAYKLINCRPVTAEEKTRANAGRYNLESVNDYSVVSLTP
jgi:NHL repeat